MAYLGIDVGGSGIKGALVDTEKGVIVSERIRVPTPEGGKPNDVTMVIKEIADQLQWEGSIGIGFPSIVKNGIVLSAANIHKSWIGIDAEEFFTKRSGRSTFVLNDADAAGIAEMTFGSGRGFEIGVVLVLTFGTGIGSAIFVNGQLLPNSELGHLNIRGKEAEKRASAAVKTKKKLGWGEWSKRLQEFLSHVEFLLSPDVIIIGGGISKQADKFLPFLNVKAKLFPAYYLNKAGIIGAAIYSQNKLLNSAF